MFVLKCIGIAILCLSVFLCIMLGLVFWALSGFNETDEGL